MKFPHKVFFIFILFVFVLGFTLCLDPSINKESMTNMLYGNAQLPPGAIQSENQPVDASPDCPDLLVRSGTKLYLHNTKAPKGEMNPTEFNSLSEYLDFLKQQREVGIRCPVLFLQEEVNTQGQTVYRARPGPNDMVGGLPIQPTANVLPAEIFDASRDNLPYNKDQYAGFDAHGQHIGEFTELDAIHTSTEMSQSISDNPMDANWGGVQYSREAVDSGKYDDRIVGKPTLVPKVVEIYK